MIGYAAAFWQLKTGRRTIGQDLIRGPVGNIN